MSNDKVIDISTKRLGFLNPKEDPQRMGAMGDLMKKVCGIDLFKVAVIMQTIEPLLRIERQTPEAFQRKQREYLGVINSYDENTCLSLINNSKEEEWKHRPIFFFLLMERAFKKNIPGFPQP